jgi:Tfp pilus assembly protein FimV
MNVTPVLLDRAPYVEFPRTDVGAPTNDDFDNAPPQPVVAPHATLATHPAAALASYRVRAGDSLWLIAQSKLRPNANAAVVGRLTQSIYVANKAVIGRDSSQLAVGIILKLG